MRLEIGEIHTRVRDADLDIIRSIDNACSYIQENWEFAQSAMIKKANANDDDDAMRYALDWDGRIRFMQGIRFPTGLLTRVLQRLEIERVTGIEIADMRRRPIPVGPPLAMTPLFEKRDYQSDAIDIAFRKTRGVIKAPTGSGKTVIGTALMARAHVPTLIIVNKKVLLEQWRDAILDFIEIIL